MIEESRYTRLVYHMGKDIQYLCENFEQFKTPLKNVFGDKTKSIENRLHWIQTNQKELADDLRNHRFYEMMLEIDSLKKENEELKKKI
jgi:hypothetical protein